MNHLSSLMIITPNENDTGTQKTKEKTKKNINESANIHMHAF